MAEFHIPDPEAMERALELYRREPAGIILTLAWRAGLTRGEIHRLTWAEADPERQTLWLPDREVPLEPAAAEALARWRRQTERIGEYVAVSPRLHTHLAPESISALAAKALTAVGQRSVRLSDLRCDYIRRQLQTHDWPYVLRVSGVSVAAWRSRWAGLLGKEAEQTGISAAGDSKTPSDGGNPPLPGEVPPVRSSQERDADARYRLWRLMQRDRTSPGGIALWLVQQMELTLAEAAKLTWEDADLGRGRLRTETGERPIPQGVLRVLRDELARREPGEDPHILLSPRSRTPLSPDRLSVLVRESLIRGGFEEETALDLRTGALRDMEWRTLRDHLESQGSLTPREAGALLDMPEARAYRRLQSLVERGYLVHLGRKYYSAEKTPPAAQARELIVRRAAEGGITAKDAAEALNIPPRQAGRLLRAMLQEGLLTPGSARGRYEAAHS